MLKIDLHIHTVRTDLDPQNFDFDLKLLQDYVSRAELDAIAITNHNTFSRQNFKEVQQSVSCAVFPGIEVNVATPGGYGHALVIAPTDDLEDFAKDALALESKFDENNGRLSWADISDGFRNIGKYLVIPHYKKAKQLDLQTISSIRKTTGDLYRFFGHASLRFAWCKSSIIACIEERTSYGFIQSVHSRIQKRNC